MEEICLLFEYKFDYYKNKVLAKKVILVNKEIDLFYEK